MKKVLLVLTVMFGIIGFIGSGYVLYMKGQVSPGYAVIPMLFCISCSQGYIAFKRKDNDKENKS